MARRLVINPATGKLDVISEEAGSDFTFLELTDTPSSYSSQAENFVKVNAGETAVEFLDLFANANTWTGNNIWEGTVNLFTGQLTSTGGITATGEIVALQTPDSLTMSERLVHTSDSDTYIAFAPDTISFNAGGIAFLVIDEAVHDTITFFANVARFSFMEFRESSGGTLTIRFNDDGQDMDIIMESENNTSFFFLNSGLDRLTIGSNTSLAFLGIDGQSDEIQFLVQGNATQTADIFVIETSDGTDLFQVNTTQVIIAAFSSAGLVKNDASGVLSGGGTIDISDDTNLSATLPLVLTGDVLSINTIDISTETNLAVTSPISLTNDTIGFLFNTNNTWTGTNIYQEDVTLDGVGNDGYVWDRSAGTHVFTTNDAAQVKQVAITGTLTNTPLSAFSIFEATPTLNYSQNSTIIASIFDVVVTDTRTVSGGTDITNLFRLKNVRSGTGFSAGLVFTSGVNITLDDTAEYGTTSPQYFGFQLEGDILASKDAAGDLTATVQGFRCEIAVNPNNKGAGEATGKLTVLHFNSSWTAFPVIMDTGAEHHEVTGFNFQPNIQGVLGFGAESLVLYGLHYRPTVDAADWNTSFDNYIIWAESGDIVIDIDATAGTTDGRLIFGELQEFEMYFDGSNAIYTTSTGLHAFAQDVTVPGETYGGSWDGSDEVPTKNDVYDKIETLTSVIAYTMKTSDQTISTQSEVNDTDFSFSVAADTTYSAVIYAMIAGDTGDGIIIDVTFPSSPTNAWYNMEGETGSSGNVVATGTQTSGVDGEFPVSSTPIMYTITIGIRNGSNAGTVQLRWRKITGAGGNPTVESGSWMEVRTWA